MGGIKHVRSFSIYESAIRRLGEFRVIFHVSDSTDLEALGFSEAPKEGDSVVPTPRGKYSDFNANGKQITRKDLPKVRKTFMVWRTWNDWHGNPHSGTQYPSRDVYQKKLIPPPCEYLTLCAAKRGVVLCSRPLSVTADSEEAIVHVLNLYLELFGGFDLVKPDLESENTLSIKRLHWKVLPPGPYPFARAKSELADFIGKLPEEHRHVVQERVKGITQHTPDFIALGVGGFSDYMVFGFPRKDVYILESPALGNATYVFKGDWESLSMRSKKEILDGSLHEARVIHNSRWNAGIRQVITQT